MNCNIILHQGYGDLFNSIGLINYYSFKYDKLYIYLLDKSRLKLYNYIFKNNDKIVTIIPIFKNYDQVTHPQTCFNCMTSGQNGNNCRNRVSCKYIDYNFDGDIIKIGAFNEPIKWERFRKTQISFAHAFYTYTNIPTNIRFDYFALFNDKDTEFVIYEKFIKKYGTNYILIHEDVNRYGNIINKNKIINKALPIINLDRISDNFVDYIKVIKNANEIHLIDSSWSVFIYLLSNKEINNIPIFLNESYFINKGRDTNIYKNPTFPNWTFY
jgi:hypothetical protein